MIQFKKMSRTVVSAAVLVTLAAAASAGTVTMTAQNVAQEAFGTGVDATTPVVIPASTTLGYQFSTPGGIVINPGGTIHVTLTAANAKFSSAGTVNLPTGTGGTLVGTATVDPVSGVIDIALSNGSTATSNAVIGVGAIVSINGASVVNAMGLATGTAVTASGSVGVAAGGAELEAASSAKPIITSLQAVSVAAAAAAETAKIDVTTTTTADIGKVLVGQISATANVETLGSVTFTNSTVPASNLAGTAIVDLGNTTAYPATNTPVTYTLSLASGAFSAGATYSLATGSCGTTGTSVTSTQAPTTIAASTTTVTLSSLGVPVSGTPILVCATFPGNATITPYKANLAAVLTGTGSYLGETLAATPMYDLGYNGASVTVRNYIPSGVTGYIQTVRLINTGNSTATAFVSLIDDTTGVATTPVAVGSPMAPGSAQRLSQAAIETAVGPIAATARPRLRFTAATSTIEAQSFFNNANGAYTNLVGQDTN